MTEIKLVRGDKNYSLEFTIYDADNNLVDLSNVTSIVLKIKKYGSSSLFASIEGSVEGDGTTGQCSFPIGTTFLTETGEFKAEIEITYSTGKVITAPGILIKVIPDLGG